MGGEGGVHPNMCDPHCMDMDGGGTTPNILTTPHIGEGLTIQFRVSCIQTVLCDFRYRFSEPGNPFFRTFSAFPLVSEPLNCIWTNIMSQKMSKYPGAAQKCE